MAGSEQHDLALDKRIRAALAGPIVGTYLDLILSGICIQLLIRYVHSKGRSTWERSIVYAACLFALTNSVIHFHQIIDVALVHYGDTDRVVKFDWNFQITFLMNGIVLALVQSIYVYRVIKLYGSQLWMKISLGALIFVGLLVNMGPSILSFAVPKPQSADDPQQVETYRLLKKYEPIIMIMYIMNMVVDLVVCVATTVALRKSMKKVTNRTANFLKQYALLSIQAMALPLACSIAAISMYNVTEARSSMDVAAVWPMHKLALLSLFLLLLNRDHYRSKLNKNPDMSFELCSPTSPHRVNIEHHTNTEVVQDDYSPKHSVNRIAPRP